MTINSRFSVPELLLTLLLFFGGLSVSTPAAAQSFDHERHPRLDFDFENLDLQLSLRPDSLYIEGRAEYRLRANITGADSIVLYAAHMVIRSVGLDNEEADFHLSNDSLIVSLPDSSEKGQPYDLNIEYSSKPRFGLLSNVNGTIWTSLLPKSQRHWVPIVDNPHVAFSGTFEFTVPSGYTVWAAGRETGQEVTSVDNVRYRFAGEREIPASGLAFAAGNFHNSSTSFGIKRINVAVEEESGEGGTGQQILQEAYDMLKNAEDEFGSEYPFERLNIVLLDDHHWETKSWGAATVFLYRNRGDWKAQLQRGIVAQWFGVFQREEQWSEGDAVTLYQAAGVEKLGGGAAEITAEDSPEPDFSTVYRVFGPERWEEWRQGLRAWENENMRSVIMESSNSVLRETDRVIGWEDYAGHWYRKSGQPLFEVPDLAGEQETGGDRTDSVAYKVTYDLDEGEGRLILGFEALHGVYNELTTLKTYEIYSGRTDTAEITFTGTKDSLIVNVDPAINTFRIDTAGYPNLHLDQYKPASFLIYELRNAETAAERAEAAGKLGHHAGDPDLQLAIGDFMKRDLEPEVYAALLRSMAKITQGASGTEEIFTGALENGHREVREAALTALQNYSGNETVINSVERAARNADDMELFQKASKVLTAITGADRYRTFVSGTVKTDTAGFRAIYATRELANMGSTEIAVKQAALYLDPEFEYGVREAAMQILIQNDHAPADWISRADDLLSDRDPRIRYLLVQGFSNIRDEEVQKMVRERIQDEYDARVHRALERLMESEK